MAVNTQWVTCALSQWTQVCELRPTRKALILQLSDGIGVFAYATNGPMVAYNGQEVPAGLPQQVGSGAVLNSGSCLAPTRLELSRELHGDMVEQAWYAWILPGGTGPQFVQFFASGTWTVPDGVTSVTLYAYGAGGGSYSGSGHASEGTGGGGGGAAAVTTLTVSSGDVITVNVSAGGLANGAGPAVATWASNTGIAPVGVADGVLADFGTDGANGVLGGTGGLVANCVGDTAFAGGDGGVAGAGFSGQYTGGGGGGGNSYLNNGGQAGMAGLGQNGVYGGGVNGGNAGSLSPIGPADGQPGSNGGPNGGGGGGGGATILPVGPVYGTGANGGNGYVEIDYIGPADAGIVVTVIESFDVADQSPPEMFTVPLPTLSPEAIADLQRILAQLDPE